MNKPAEFVREVWHGKTIGRILLNWHIHDAAKDLKGRGLDAAGGSGSYYRYLPSGLSITRTNLSGDDLDQVVDLNKPLPFEDASFDFVLCLNANYILEDQELTLRELQRLLKKGGVLVCSSPLLAAEMPEPHDYVRLTQEGLERLFAKTGWQKWEIERYGERFTVAASLTGELLPRVLKLAYYILALLGDRLIPHAFKATHPAPLGYVCVVTK